MSLLDRILACNNGKDTSNYFPFCVADTQIGWIHRQFASALAPFVGIFERDDVEIALSSGLIDYRARTDAVDSALRLIDQAEWFSAWRDEPYPVGTGFYTPPLFEMERVAVPRFGVQAFGVHINGFVRDGDRIFMWIARRADDKPTYPGMLDNMIAGGQPVGIGLKENVIKEAGEEAGVPRELAATAKPVGALSYRHEEDNMLKPDVMFIYDLELPADFVPRNMDGEAAEFRLLPVEQVLQITADTADFKFNCSVVNIDFFIRHGVLTPDDADYVDILRGMHR
jgi:isopentenyldiphosphate isomerase